MTDLTLSEMSRMGGNARWKNLSPTQRKAAMQKVREAREKKARKKQGKTRP